MYEEYSSISSFDLVQLESNSMGRFLLLRLGPCVIRREWVKTGSLQSARLRCKREIPGKCKASPESPLRIPQAGGKGVGCLRYRSHRADGEGFLFSFLARLGSQRGRLPLRDDFQNSTVYVLSVQIAPLFLSDRQPNSERIKD